jgi:hypothetical protein
VLDIQDTPAVEKCVSDIVRLMAASTYGQQRRYGAAKMMEDVTVADWDISINTT